MTVIDKLIGRLPRSWEIASPGNSPTLNLQTGYAAALDVASTDVGEAVAQMDLSTADDLWLDEWGSYFDVPRILGEADRDYAARMIAEVLRPRCNNAAIAAAVELAFGQPCSVNDVIEYRGVIVSYNGAYSHNGVKSYNDSSSTVYGQFDVEAGYSLDSGIDYAVFAAAVRDFIERYRAAGTRLRTVSLGGAQFDSDAQLPTDDGAGVILTVARYNATWGYNGVLTHVGTSPTDLFVS